MNKYRKLNKLIKLIGALIKYDGCSVIKLKQILNISLSTVYRYIGQLTKAGFPIERDNNKIYRLKVKLNPFKAFNLRNKPEILGAKAVNEMVYANIFLNTCAFGLLVKLNTINENGFLCDLV